MRSGGFAHPAGGVSRATESDSLNGRVPRAQDVPPLGGNRWKTLVQRGGPMLEPGERTLTAVAGARL
jgi:hypothetical protein